MIPIGARIRFLRRLYCGPTGDHPGFLYARRGELGKIVGYGTVEGYWVCADGWPERFGAIEDEFEVIAQETKP